MKKSRKQRREEGAPYTRYQTDALKTYCVALAENRYERRLLSGVYPWQGLGEKYREAARALTNRLFQWGITIYILVPRYDKREVVLREGTNILRIELEIARRENPR